MNKGFALLACISICCLPVSAQYETFADNWKFAGIAVEEPGYTIWGTSPLMGEDGTVHLFVARWPCELKVDPGWRSHSEIAHYVGETPEGPFKFSDVAITGTGKETWDQRHVLEGAANSGFWPVEIGVEGWYQFDVRRWPKEIDHPINASLPAEGISDIFLNSKPVGWVKENQYLP